jgi:hypothetical protein
MLVVNQVTLLGIGQLLTVIAQLDGVVDCGLTIVGYSIGMPLSENGFD